MKRGFLSKISLPDSPGVYFFLAPRTKSLAPRILYIGKATSLKDRVRSYMSKTVFDTRGPLIMKMLEEATAVKFSKTDSVLEALILEASLIKKHQPIYNSKEKDDKSYNYVTFTEEDFPRVLIVRGKDLVGGLPREAKAKWGPFPYGKELKEALKIIRKIFPYRDDKCRMNGKPCFDAQIGLCPGVCAGWISKTEYRKTIRHLNLFFEAKKPKLIKSLEKEMKSLAKEHKFEDAEKAKRKIFALNHIQDIALLKSNTSRENFDGLTRKWRAPTPIEISSAGVLRIEAYDIAHISGTDVVGVMTVITNGEVDKSQYRKFKISRERNDDVGSLKEMLTRRLIHREWRLPDLIVVDGGVGQINAVKEILKKSSLNIEVVSVVKDERHKARGILGKSVKSRAFDISDKLILLANSEAHRFAIGYHRQLRGKGFKI